MGKVIVRTKEELEKAVNNEVKTIIIKGELAEKVNLALKVKKSTLILLAGAAASTPLTGGLSLPLIAALTGLEIPWIVVIIFLGIALVILLVNNYKRVSFKAKKGDFEAELVLERKEE